MGYFRCSNSSGGGGTALDITLISEPSANDARANNLTYSVTEGKTYMFCCGGRTSTKNITITNAEVIEYFVPTYYVNWGGRNIRNQIVFFRATSSSVFIEDHGTDSATNLYGPILFQLD